MKPLFMFTIVVFLVIGFQTTTWSCMNDSEVLVREHQFKSTYNVTDGEPGVTEMVFREISAIGNTGLLILISGILLGIKGISQCLGRPGQ